MFISTMNLYSNSFFVRWTQSHCSLPPSVVSFLSLRLNYTENVITVIEKLYFDSSKLIHAGPTFYHLSTITTTITTSYLTTLQHNHHQLTIIDQSTQTKLFRSTFAGSITLDTHGLGHLADNQKSPYLFSTFFVSLLSPKPDQAPLQSFLLSFFTSDQVWILAQTCPGQKCLLGLESFRLVIRQLFSFFLFCLFHTKPENLHFFSFIFCVPFRLLSNFFCTRFSCSQTFVFRVQSSLVAGFFLKNHQFFRFWSLLFIPKIKSLSMFCVYFKHFSFVFCRCSWILNQLTSSHTHIHKHTHPVTVAALSPCSVFTCCWTSSPTIWTWTGFAQPPQHVHMHRIVRMLKKGASTFLFLQPSAFFLLRIFLYFCILFLSCCHRCQSFSDFYYYYYW